MLKKLLPLILIATVSNVFATEVIRAIPDGSYYGRFEGSSDGKVSMLAKSYPGCQGCFIATFIVAPGGFLSRNKTPQLAVYSAAPRNVLTSKKGNVTSQTSTIYDLNPFGVDKEDGKLTLPIADPALVLEVGENTGTDDVHFRIVEANQVNTMGIRAPMAFERERRSPFSMSVPQPGHYKEFGDHKNFLALDTVEVDSSDKAKSVQTFWSGDGRLYPAGGHFILREQAQDTFSFTRISSLATGDKEEKMPAFITLFFEEHGHQIVLMVNPAQTEDVRRYDLDNGDRDPQLQSYTATADQLSVPLATNVDAQANAPKSWEYPGSPTSVVTQAEIDTLKKWAVNALMEISDIKHSVEKVISDDDRKKILVTRIQRLSKGMEFSQKDLLMRQSLAAGLTLVNILEASGETRGATAGTTSAENNILMRAMEKALDYYKSDLEYTSALENHDQSIQYSKRAAVFGLDLSTYIAEMSLRLRPINLLASYGALQWCLGVLQRKLYDDDAGRSVLHTVIEHLDESLKDYPDFDKVNPASTDADLAIAIMKLRSIYEDTQGYIKQLGNQ